MTTTVNTSDDTRHPPALRDLVLYRALPAMMHVVDADGVIVEVSDLWLATLGYAHADVLGRRLNEFLAPEPSADWPEGDCVAASGQIVAKDGSVVDVELSSRVDLTEPEAPRTLSVLTDVTARNRTHQVLEARVAELEHANEGLEQFSYTAAHDLKAPLRRIEHSAELLADEFGARLQGEGRIYLDEITRSAQGMRQLISDLLVFSEALHREQRLARADLTRIAQNAVDQLDLAIADAAATVEIEGLPSATCDAAMIEQVFHNLIANALKYRHADRALEIAIGARIRSDWTEVFVRDNGTGFDPAHADRVFEPFTRLHQKTVADGSGVGLALCRAVCARHGWEIRVEAQPNVGCTFVLRVE